MEDKWIDSIREKMADYDAVPPAGLLDAIEAKVRAGRMRRKRILVAVAASVALIGVVSVALIPYMTEVTQRPLVMNVSVDGMGENAKKGCIDQMAEKMVAQGQVSSSPRSERKASGSRPDERESEAGETSEIEYGREDRHEDPVDEDRTDTGHDASSDRVDDHLCPEYLSSVQTIDSHSGSHVPVSVEVSTSATGLGGVFGDGDIENRPLSASASMPLTRMGGGMLGGSNSNSLPAPTFVEMFYHKIPVRASVDFSWLVWHNLHVGTGVTYSYLRSDIRYGYSGSPLFKATQSLHFIGIPVNARYTPWNFRNLDIYVSAGFMAEKCMGVCINTEDPSDSGYSYDGCDERPFQFSFNAAAGLQYSLTGKCAVFIEPGIGMYLKNGSRLRTIYSERPLTFNVNVGLRFGH